MITKDYTRDFYRKILDDENIIIFNSLKQSTLINFNKKLIVTDALPETQQKPNQFKI